METSKLNKKSDITNGLNSLSRIDKITVNENTGEWIPINIPSDINPVVAYLTKLNSDDIVIAPWFLGEGTKAYQEIVFSNRIEKNTITGLLNTHVTYTANIAISGSSGGNFVISIYGDENQTYENLILNINRQITGGRIELFEGSLRLVHNLRGLNTVLITDTNLFSSLTNTPAINLAVNGENYTNYSGNVATLIFPFYPDLVGVISDRPFMWVRSATMNTNIITIAWFE